MEVDIVNLVNTFKNISINIINSFTSTASSMLYIFIMIDLTLTMLFNKDDGLEIFMTLMKKTLLYGFFGWIILNFHNIILNQILPGFIQLGNIASGVGNGTTLAFDLGVFMNKLSPITQGGLFVSGAALVVSDKFGLESLPMGIVLCLLIISLLIIMTVAEIMIVFVKFYLVSAFSIILMPFGVFSKTRDIAIKGLHAIFSMSIEIMIMVTVCNLSFSLFPDLSIKGKLTFNVILLKLLPSVLMFLLIKKVPTMTSTLLSGTISNIGLTDPAAAGISRAMMASGSGIKSGISSMKASYDSYKNASSTTKSASNNNNNQISQSNNNKK